MAKKKNTKNQSSSIASGDNVYDEIFESGSLIVARKGRFVFMENRATPEEHKQAMLELSQSMGEYRGSVEKQIAELEEILQKYPPLDIIGNMCFRNTIINFDDYKEYESKQNLAYAEYVALLYLCKPESDYPKIVPPIHPGVIEDIQERVRKLFSQQIFYLAFKNVDPDDPTPDMLEQLRVRTLMQSLLIGETAYHHHRIEMTKDLFVDVNKDLQRILGFTVDDVLKIADGVQRIINQRLLARKQEVSAFVKDLLKAVKVYRLKKRIDSEFSTELITELGSLQPSEAKERAISIAAAWVFFRLGETLAFTPGYLAEETGLEQATIEKYLTLFSLEFGKVDPKFYRYPAPTHPLRTKPIIKFGDKFFCPVPPSIYSGLRLALEEYLNPANKNSINRDLDIWSEYEKSRASYLEKKALEYLGKCLKHAQVYGNLKYKVVEGGEQKEAELDGLLLLDNALFIVEGKAGGLSQPARRGAPSMVEDIKNLVENAHNQALRAKKYILECDKPEFNLLDGTKVVVSKDKFDQIFLVNVTLENLDSFIVNLYKLRDLGLVSYGEFPWSICITDLRVISEVVETSCEFVHYLLRRLRINDLAFVEAHDELDWFGHYLHEGLYFEDFLPSAGENQIMTLGSYTTSLDDYYYYLLGLRQKPAPKPRQPMPEIFRQFIDELESVHLLGCLKAACALLDMGSESRKDFSKGLVEIRKRAIHDRRAHNFTMVFSEDRFGITCVSLPQERFLELRSKLGDYCLSKKQELGLDLWVGFGNIADTKKLISYLLVIDEPIKFYLTGESRQTN